jgi:hypothetical protein
VLKKKKDGPSRGAEEGSSQYGSRYSMYRTYGPRDITSLVILRLGDNKTYVDNFPLKKTPLSLSCNLPLFGSLSPSCLMLSWSSISHFDLFDFCD